MPAKPSPSATAFAAILALIGFAANQLLCRKALGQGEIDALSFTAVRLAAGAVTLLVLARSSGLLAIRASLRSGLFLLAYAVAFSLGYRQLGAGTGALIHFGMVQTTMIGWGIAQGEHPGRWEWAGLAISLAGVVAMVLPSVSAPPLLGASFMMAAGLAWAGYSLLGRGSQRPLAGAAASFLIAAPIAAGIAAISIARGGTHYTQTGLWLAIGSGSLASGVGYALWYAALRGLSAPRAAIVQLAVPVVSATGGVALLGEHVGARLVGAGAAILAGVALAVLGPKAKAGK